jgi:type IV pilus assembly protein PilB
MKQRLGETLLALGAIDAMQLNSALALQRQWGMPLGRAIVQQRFCTSEQVLSALSLQTGLPTVNLDTQTLDVDLACRVPKTMAERLRIVPLRRQGDGKYELLVVAMAAPATTEKQDAVREVTGAAEVVPVLATDEAIERAIARLYGGGDQSASVPRSGLETTPEEESEPLSLKPMRPVFIYGWPARAAKLMAKLLATEGIAARMIQTEDVLWCEPDDVVVASLPAVEQLLQVNPKLAPQWVVAVKNREADALRAANVGARVLLQAPVDPELMVRAVKALRLPVAAPAPAPAAEAEASTAA